MLKDGISAERRPVLIYRDRLLPASETFILSQGEALRSYLPFYIGVRRVEGLELPPGRSFAVNDGGASGRVKEFLFNRANTTGYLKKQVAHLQPALVHAHFGPDAAHALPLVRQLGLPLVVSFHGYDATKNDDWFRRSLFDTYLKRRDELKEVGRIFIANSQFTRAKLVERGFPSEKIRVHYIGIDTGRFAPDQTVERVPIVLFVGRLVENKGCEFLVRAMAEVQRTRSDIGLLVIGDGPLRTSLESLGKDLKTKVRFLGAQPPESVLHWLRRSLVFSVPSVTIASGESEGFGLVFLEAQACGVPVASFRTGGIPESVQDGETGLLCDERDWRGLAKNIHSLLGNEALWSHFSVAGRERVSRLFDLQKQTSLLEKIYAEAQEGVDG